MSNTKSKKQKQTADQGVFNLAWVEALIQDVERHDLVLREIIIPRACLSDAIKHMCMCIEFDTIREHILLGVIGIIFGSYTIRCDNVFSAISSMNNDVIAVCLTKQFDTHDYRPEGITLLRYNINSNPLTHSRYKDFKKRNKKT